MGAATVAADGGAVSARRALLGAKFFTLGPDKTIKVIVTLSAKTRHALARRRIRVRAIAVLRDPTGNTRTIRRTLTLVLK
jgi:hypothetical protein